MFFVILKSLFYKWFTRFMYNIFKIIIKIYDFNRTISKMLYIIDNYSTLLIYNFFGVVFLIYMFYNRLFIDRLPKNLHEIHLFYTMIGIIILFLHIFLLYKNTKKLFETDEFTETSQNKFYKHIKHIKIYFRYYKIKYIHKEDIQIIKKIIECLNLPKRIEDAYIGFLGLINESAKFRDYYYIFISRILLKSKYRKISYYIIFIFPRILVTLVFFFEIIYFKEINYFYKILWVLLIPLIGKIIRFSVKILSVIYINKLFKIVTYEILELNNEELKNTSTCKYYYCSEEQITYKYYWVSPDCVDYFEEEDLTEIFTEEFNCRTMYNFSKFFYNVENTKTNIIINMIISFLLIISWIYIIIKMFKLIF